MWVFRAVCAQQGSAEGHGWISVWSARNLPTGRGCRGEVFWNFTLENAEGAKET